MAAITSTATGVYNVGATWVGGVAPGALDTAIIAAGHVVTVTVNQVCLGITINATGELVIDDGVAFTGMTASMTNNGTLTIGAGATFSFNSAGNVTASNLIYVNGTSVSIVTIQNAGAGNLNFLPLYPSLIKWADIDTYLTNTSSTAVWGIFEDCQINFGGTRPAMSGGIIFRRCFIYGYTSDCRFWQVTEYPPWENIAWGYNRAGAAQAVGRIAAGSGGIIKHLQNAIINNVSIVNCDRRGMYGLIENRGWLTPSMLPGTGSNLDIAQTSPGISWLQNYVGVIERSTAAKKTGDYGARCTPNSRCDADGGESLESSIYIPIATGEDIAVSVYGRRHTMTNDCAEVEIDPEGVWFTPDTDATVLTNDDTWYEFTPSASTAGGSSDSGMVRIVLHLKEYQSAAYMDWADCVIVAGGITYNINFDAWSMGQPTPSEPDAGGGLVAVANKRGNKQ